MSTSFKNLALPAVCLGALMLSACGGGEDASTTNISNVATPSSASCSATFSQASNFNYNSLLAKYRNDPQCSTQVQAAESYRQSAIANCAAGSTTGAKGNYEYYLTSVKYSNSICP